jgi:hypothetical protein
MIECGSCKLRFTSNSAFDMHRTGGYGDAIYNTRTKRAEVIGYTKHTRRCLSEEEMNTKGMRKLDDGRWTTGQTFSFVKGDDEAEAEIEEQEEEEAVSE